MAHRALRPSLAALSISLSLSLVPSLARAQPPAVAPPAVAPPAVVPPSQPPEPRVQPPVVIGEHTCHVSEHAGIDDADARTTTDLVCGELAALEAIGGIYDVRFGKLGTRVLLSVTKRATGANRRMLIQSFEEVPVAAHRLVAALVEHKSVEGTQNIDNVIASESRQPTNKSLAISTEFGLVGVTAVGVAPNASAGAMAGVMLRNSHLSFGSHVRGGGAGSSSNKLVFAGIDLGVRYHLSDAASAPFVGGGVTLAYLKIARDPVGPPPGTSGWATSITTDLSPSGSGFGAYLEGGVELLRSSRVGAALSLRVDAPFYVLEAQGTLGSGLTAKPASVSRYVVPVSLNLGFAFR